jgi:hypothetical protein
MSNEYGILMDLEVDMFSALSHVSSTTALACSAGSVNDQDAVAQFEC